MLFSRVFVSFHPSAERPADVARVAIFDDATQQLLFGAWDRAEAVYGADSGPVRAVLQRYCGDGAVACWPLDSRQDAERFALDESKPGPVRGVCAALALGRPIGGDAQGPKGPDGGQPARLDAPKPRKPSPAAKASPFAQLQGATP